MARNLLEVKSKTSTLAGILCNIEDKEEGVKGGENSDNKNHMVALEEGRELPVALGQVLLLLLLHEHIHARVISEKS